MKKKSSDSGITKTIPMTKLPSDTAIAPDTDTINVANEIPVISAAIPKQPKVVKIPTDNGNETGGTDESDKGKNSDGSEIDEMFGTYSDKNAPITPEITPATTEGIKDAGSFASV